MKIKTIGTIYTDFEEKFGLPRQSGLVESLKGRIVMEKEYRIAEAFRGLEEYSHIWVIWNFHRAPQLAGGKSWEPTVRPPRLGGNTRVGVFASRSPVRPNGLAMSCLKLDSIDFDAEDGPVLNVSGIDMLNGTPIFDIKPYVKAADCKPGAVCGFADITAAEETTVICEKDALSPMPEELRKTVAEILSEDPTPRYIEDKTRIFGFEYAGWEIKFRKEDGKIVVISAEQL